MDQQSKLKRIEEEFRKQELLMSEARKAEMKARYEEAYTKAEFSLQKLGPRGLGSVSARYRTVDPG